MKTHPSLPLTLVAAASTLYAASLQAQSAPEPALAPVVVNASRQLVNPDDLPLSAQVYTRDTLDARLVSDIRDLVQDEPNLSVKHAPARYTVTGKGNPTGADGNTGISIRGQGGNRVVVLVDGVRQPRAYINGSNAFGRDAVALGLVQQVEVLRGPASALHGSDALAGVVQFVTVQPQDLLRDSQGGWRDQAARAWASASSEDDGWALGTTVARRLGPTAALSLSATGGQAHALDNQGDNPAADQRRTTPNPQDQADHSLLAQLDWRPDGVTTHHLSLESLRRSDDVWLLSSRAPLPYTGTVAVRAALVADERAASHLARERLSWRGTWAVKLPLADQLRVSASLQDSQAQQDGQTVRVDSGVRLRRTDYRERNQQLTLQAQKTWNLGTNGVHTLTYGWETVRTDVSTLTTGSDPKPLPTFKARAYFPDTRDSSDSLYVQSEWLRGAWSVVPGLRLDRYSLDAANTPAYYPGLSATAPVSLSGTALTPKLGVLWQAAPTWTLYGQWAKGFRAPEGQQVNSALEVSTAKLLPNPNLQPENSRSIELGARLRRAQLQMDAAVFVTRYDQLIEDKRNLGTANGLPASLTNPTLFQTVNIDRASLYGWELQGRWTLGQTALGRWSLPFGYGQVRGYNDVTGKPLTSLDPAKTSLGLALQTPRWDVTLGLTHHAAKAADEIDSAYIPKSTTLLQFLPPSATTWDLNGQWRPRKGVRVNAAVRNLTDATVWHWADVQGLASNANPLVVDAYTQPGRSLTLSVIWDL